MSFDPCAIFPARVKKRRFVAEPMKPGAGVGGATDLLKGKVFLPTANTAYGRTVRLHEALHAIYTPKPTKAFIKSGKGFTMLDQALEDARLHLNCARTSGPVRRDELSTALRDLHKTTSARATENKELAALIALRSASILRSQTYAGKTMSARGEKKLKQLCSAVDNATDPLASFADVVGSAIAHIRAGKLAEAREALQPYFSETEEQPTQVAFPSAGNGEIAPEMAGEAQFSFEKLEGKLTSDAAELLSPSTLAAVEGTRMPTLFLHQLFATSMIPTFFGETQKHVISGCKISAKKLATIVGPSTPKIFLKTIRRNGGTVLIDASGSMSLTPANLLALVQKAPASTIAFYNAPKDISPAGNLWIYCHKGKRAADFKSIKMLSSREPHMVRDKHGRLRHLSETAEDCKNVWGYGNVVDFQALQWLLTQDKPRYILTDGGFTGVHTTSAAAHELLYNALARKKMEQVRNLKAMEAILFKGV